MSLSDPNLNPNFDWIPPNCTDTYNVDLYSPTGVHINVPLPYCSNQFTGAGEIGKQDVKKEDGWRLFYKDFGLPQHGTRTPGYILYNKYTGTFRAFLYSAVHHEDFSHAFVSVTKDFQGSGGNQKPALFTFQTVKTLANYNQNQNVIAAVKLVNQGWFYFDFDVIGYQPNIGDSKFKNSELAFDVIGVDVTNLSIGGDLSLDALYSSESSNFFSSSGDILSEINGDAAASFLGNFDSQSKYANTRADSAQKKGKSGIANSFINLAQVAFKQFIPGVAGFADFVGGLIGGNSAPRLTGFNGKITLSGNSNTLHRGLIPYFLRIPNTQMSNNVGRPIYSNPIGIYNLEDEPTLDYIDSKKLGCTPDPIDPQNPPICTYELTYSPEPLNYIINPVLKNDNSIDLSVQAAMISPVGGTGSYVDIDQFQNETYKCTSTGGDPFGSNSCYEGNPKISLKIQISKPSDPDFDKIILRVYPFIGDLPN